MADLNGLLQRLLANKIDFVLVGGFAGVVHGSSQLTRDIDICMDLCPPAIQRLRTVLADLRPVHRQTPQKLSFLDHPSDLTNVRNLYLQTDLGPLDILSEIIGVGPYRVVSARSISLLLFGTTCSVMSLDDLISSKSALRREKDRPMLLELELIRNRETAGKS